MLALAAAAAWPRQQLQGSVVSVLRRHCRRLRIPHSISTPQEELVAGLVAAPSRDWWRTAANDATLRTLLGADAALSKDFPWQFRLAARDGAAKVELFARELERYRRKDRISP